MTSVERLIILQYTKIKDSALVLHTLSRSQGRRSFVVHLGKGSSLALFQPLSLVEADVAPSLKSELARARAFSQVRPLISIRQEPYKNAIVLFMSEVLYRCIKDGMGDDALFDWCERSIATLEELRGDYSNFHLMFLLGLAAQLGFSPSAGDIAPFAGERFQDACRLLSLPYSEALMLPLSGERRSELCDVFLRYIAHHSESALDIRSLAVLKEIL